MKKFIPLMALSLALLAGCNTQIDTDGPTIDPSVNEQIKDDAQNGAIDGDETDSETGETDEPAVTESNDLTYVDAKYGFSLTFPETWKGYTAKNRELNWGENGTSDSIDFGLPGQEDLFNISISTPEQSAKIQAEEGSKPTILGKDGSYVYAYSGSQYTANDAMAERRNELDSIIKTFKVK